MIDIPTGYIVLGSSGIGLIALFALAYEMIKSSDDVRRLVEAMRKEVESLSITVRKPDLIKIDRQIKTCYKILKSPQQKEEAKDHLAAMVNIMIEFKKKLSPMDWLHAERSNLRALTQLHNDSVDRLRGIVAYYRHR